MTIQEKRKKFIEKVNNLSDQKLIYLMEFLEQIEKKDEKYLEQPEFDKLLEEDLDQYKNVWKELA